MSRSGEGGWKVIGVPQFCREEPCARRVIRVAVAWARTYNKLGSGDGQGGAARGGRAGGTDGRDYDIVHRPGAGFCGDEKALAEGRFGVWRSVAIGLGGGSWWGGWGGRHMGRWTAGPGPRGVGW